MKTHYYCDDIVATCDNKHLTVDEIFELMSDKYPEVGKSSIYRNVERLAESGKLRKLCGV
jgi:Fe2+ or Zn2+ uptake regulation protein